MYFYIVFFQCQPLYIYIYSFFFSFFIYIYLYIHILKIKYILFIYFLMATHDPSQRNQTNVFHMMPKHHGYDWFHCVVSFYLIN